MSKNKAIEVNEPVRAHNDNLAGPVKAGTAEKYIIVGNFRSTPDESADDYTAVPSGVNITEFYFYMRAYARVHKLMVIDYLDDGIVLRGDAAAMRKLAEDTEGSYSCVCVGDKAFNELLNLRGEHALPVGA